MANETLCGLELTHRYADLGDVRLHYVEAGEGPLVLLLHGFPQFWYQWRHQIPALLEAGFSCVLSWVATRYSRRRSPPRT